jgi:hypothetical protein
MEMGTSNVTSACASFFSMCTSHSSTHLRESASAVPASCSSSACISNANTRSRRWAPLEASPDGYISGTLERLGLARSGDGCGGPMGASVVQKVGAAKEL